MPKNQFTIADFNKLFPSQKSCLQFLLFEKVPDSVCPDCRKRTKFTKLKKRCCFSCQWSGYHVYPKAGTLFEKSRTPLKTWFYTLFLMASSKNGVSAKELERQLGVTYKCAWRMAREIRTLFEEEPVLLSGVVEADEAWFGYTRRKVPVAGLVERGGRIITKVVDDVSARTLIPYICTHVAEGSAIMTDEHRPYRALRRHNYLHETTNHSKWQWKTGRASTNTLEGHWGLMKRAIRGTYGSVSERHLSLYVAEFSWKRNHRKDEEPLFSQLLASASRPS